jgi:hypothetical protein
VEFLDSMYPTSKAWMIATIVIVLALLVMMFGILRRLGTSPLIQRAPKWMVSAPIRAAMWLLLGLLTVTLTGLEVATEPTLPKWQQTLWTFVCGAGAVWLKILHIRRSGPHQLAYDPTKRTTPRFVVKRMIKPYIRQYMKQYMRRQTRSLQPSKKAASWPSHTFTLQKGPEPNTVRLIGAGSAPITVTLSGTRAAERTGLLLALEMGLTATIQSPTSLNVRWENPPDGSRGKVARIAMY